MRNCSCHNLPACKTGYGYRTFGHDGMVHEYVMDGLTRREAVMKYWELNAPVVQLMAHRRVMAERS